MDFTSHDETDIQTMLKSIGISSLDALFTDIPSELLIKELKLPPSMSEPDVLEHLKNIASKNHIYKGGFLGAGIYYHYIPSLVDYVISRGQFFTAYTPYQAEASQGFLQAIYEYQTAISRITEMDVTNASMYDGATALAEAAMMATFSTNKTKIVLIEGIHPEYIETTKTYCWGRNITVEIIPLEKLQTISLEEVAGVCFQSPNFFGEIEDVENIVKLIRSRNSKSLIIQAMSDPTCLGVLNPPGVQDIDIFIAEGQAFGIPPSFGGPGLGILSTRTKFMRKMPGRLIGITKELHGDRYGFVLTLQAREQHIRREKALSNICSNQALCMLAASVYLISMGRTGLRRIAEQNFQKAFYVRQAFTKIPGFRVINQKPTYNEFVIESKYLDQLFERCKRADLLPPLRLSQYFPNRSNQALICITELNSKLQIDQLLQIAREVAH